MSHKPMGCAYRKLRITERYVIPNDKGGHCNTDSSILSTTYYCYWHFLLLFMITMKSAFLHATAESQFARESTSQRLVRH